MILPNVRPALSRRDFLARSGCGFGAMALNYLLAREGVLNSMAAPINPLAPRIAAVVIDALLPAQTRADPRKMKAYWK